MPGCTQEEQQEEIIVERLGGEAGPDRRYRKGRLLGKGGFARVYELTDLASGRRYAGKIVQKSSLTKARAKQKLMTEIRIHRGLSHPNIVKFERYFEDSTAVYLLLELCEDQTLMELLKARRRLCEPEVVQHIRQVIAGCKYMRDQKVIHRDLKLGNLFLNQGQLKIGDFGLAAQLENVDDRKTCAGRLDGLLSLEGRTICGTPNYIAPEVLTSRQGQQGHSFEADVWSIGVVIYTLIVGRPPFETADVKSTYKRIQSCDFSFPLDRVPISLAAQSIIQQTLRKDPQSRLSLDQMLEHQFFNGPSPRPSVFQPGKRPLTNPDPESREDVKRGVRGEPRRENVVSNELPKQFESMRIGDASYSGSSLPRNSAALLELMGGSWVVNWVDYSHKYGMGYMLADSSCGACFNDTTKIVMSTDGVRAEYIGRKRERPDDGQALRFAVADYPEELHKKVTLIKHFATYLQGKSAEGALEPVQGATSATKQMVYVKKWVRTRHAVVFRLSNRMYQVAGP